MIGEKDQDGFYWGELRGRKGFVPHNMVSEIEEPQTGVNINGTGSVIRNPNISGGLQQSMRNVSRDRWGDIYCNMPVKRMIALYDYDPQELSPNVDAEVCGFQYFIMFRFISLHHSYIDDTNNITLRHTHRETKDYQSNRPNQSVSKSETNLEKYLSFIIILFSFKRN